MRRFGAALLALPPGLVIGLSWLRLEEPQRDGGRLLVLVLLAALPALATRLRDRLALLGVALLVGAAVAVRVSPLDARPWDERHDFFGPFAGRIWAGLLEFYDVRLPFDPFLHPEMHSLVLAAAFGFAAGVAVACGARRPLPAVLVLLVGAGWPSTLLPGEQPLGRGALILAAALLILAGLRPGARNTFGRAAVVGGALVVVGLVVSTQPAVAKGGFLAWEDWDLYTKPDAPVSLRYVWDANYDGFKFPQKQTTVLRVKAPGRSVYWRATTLNEFVDNRWVENHTRTSPALFAARTDVVSSDPMAPRRALDSERWWKASVEVEALADEHLVAPTVPVAYATDIGRVLYAEDGTALLDGGLERGKQYDVWAYSPSPRPARLARSPARYPPAARDYLEIGPGQAVRPFGVAGRDVDVARIFGIASGYYSSYRPLYDQARRIVGDTRSPYSAAIALETWFRRTGGFTYDQQPPRRFGAPPLVEFVTKSKRGYCQHYAGAMALMLRYLGIPARVAAGFTSGKFDEDNEMWTVTDHQAHAWVEVWFAGWGWLPFDPTPGRGSLSAPYTASSPLFDPSAAAALLAGAAARLLDQFDIKQDRSFGEKGLDGGFLTTDPRGGRPVAAPAPPHRGGSLGGLVALVLASVLLAVALAKAIRRRLRYLSRDPRRLASASRRELVDFLADQGVRIPSSAGPEELAATLRERLAVDALPFAAALAAARYGPPEAAADGAFRMRGELRSVQAQIRSRLGLARRFRGLVSLRSLGFAG